MPVYEYRCAECGHQFDHYQKATEQPLRRCPTCRGRVRKVFRPVGIIFKGSGFYTTDYRKPDEKKPPKEEKAAAGTGTTKTSD